jgi:putative membrane protein
MRFLARLFLNALAILAAAYFIPGLRLTGPLPALIAGAVLGFVNAIVRPIVLLLTLPLTLLTFGLFLFVVNAICLALTAALVPGFDIEGFWSALFGALVVTVVSWILNTAIAEDERTREP